MKMIGMNLVKVRDFRSLNKLISCVDDEWSKETPSTTQDSIEKTLPIEQQDSEKEINPTEQEENTPVKPVVEVENAERKESDTGKVVDLKLDYNH